MIKGFTLYVPTVTQSSLVPFVYETVGPCRLGERKNEIIMGEIMRYGSIEGPTVAHKTADVGTTSCNH